MYLPRSPRRLALLVSALLLGCSPGTDEPSSTTRGGGAGSGGSGGGQGGTAGRGGSGGSGASGSAAGTTGGSGTAGSQGGGSGGSGGSGVSGSGGSGGAGGSGGSGEAGSSGSGGSAGGGASDGGPAADGQGGGTEGGAPPAGPSAVPVPSPACAGGAMMPGPNGNQTIMSGGRNRTFIIRMPTGYDGKKPMPILFGFHGAGGGAASFETGVFGGLSRMTADKAIRAFPQALENTFSRDEPDDVAFMDAIMEWLKTRVCYDTARVFAGGQSSGAYFSHRWACDRAPVVRAVATNSGGQRRERVLDCKHPVAAWTSTGAADNPGHVMGTRQARDVWSKLAGCQLTGATPVAPSPCVAQPGCREGYPVHYCQHTGGHAFPGYATMGIYNFLFNSKL